MLAVSLRNQQNEKLALPFFQRASELKKSDTEIQFQYGLSLAYNEQIDHALNQLLYVTELDDQHADALYNTAVCYLHKEQPKKALTFFKKNSRCTARPHALRQDGKLKVEEYLSEG